MGLLVLIGLMPLLVYGLRLHDATIMTGAALVGAAGVTLAALARNFYAYLAIAGLGAVRSCCYPAARALISKMVDKEELLPLLIPLLALIVLLITFVIKSRGKRTDEDKSESSESESTPPWLLAILLGMSELREKMEDEIKQLDVKIARLEMKMEVLERNDMKGKVELVKVEEQH